VSRRNIRRHPGGAEIYEESGKLPGDDMERKSFSGNIHADTETIDPPFAAP
jgi:hypothetical protein